MKTSSVMLASLALVLSSPALLGAVDALAPLASAARYFGDGKAHTADFTQSYTPAGFSGARTESGTVVVQAPQFVRFDYQKPSPKTFAFDGKTARFSERAELPLVFLDSPESLARVYSLSAEETPEGVSILLTPKAAGSELAWVRLKLVAAGIPSSLSYETTAGDRTTFDFGAFHTAPARDPAAFVLRPPAGTRIVDNDP
jgi:outer membrane lipoprotein-sorting protein